MATVGGLLASAVVKVAIGKLGSFIVKQASLVWNVKKHMEDMKDTLETIAATLQDAEKQSTEDAEVRLWLKRLKNAAYDISDMLDEFQEESTRQQMTGILPVAIRKKSQATKMKTMRERLMKIQVQHTSFKFKQSTVAINDQKAFDPRETTSDVNGSDIIGRDAERLEITNLLNAQHDKDRTMILPIYGLGGIGKSTLAGLVYNDMQFKGYDHRIWVYVSQVFNLKEIGKSLILQLQTGCQQYTDTLQLINRCLDDLLKGKKVLVVLDDIWEEDDSELDRLKTMLRKNGSTIDVIVTTRSEAIASNICTHKPYQLQPLKDDICWDIIKKKSQFENKSSKDQMEQIGLNIAKKCGGVALAAQALGYMLKSKDLHGWSEVNDSDVWKKSFEDDNLPYNKVLPSLKLSFESMPPNLRLSFSYCAIFPKGHDIVEDDLIHQWIALEFITPSKGKEYMKQLLGMSFLQRSKLPSTSGNGAVRYTMHSLVHDLARAVIGDELIEIDTTTKSDMSGQKFCRYVSLKNYDGQTKLSNIFPQQVRALHVSSSSKLDLHGSAFSFAKCLRILDFSECSSILLPAYIGELKQLRYLIAPRIQNKKLPECILELSKLQYLNLLGSSQISTVPKTIGKLSCLVYLGLSGCSGISEVPESVGDLKGLAHLDLSGCSGISKLPESVGDLIGLIHLDLSGCFNLGKLPEALGNLTELRYLNMSGCSQLVELPETFQDLQNLMHLDLSSCVHVKLISGALYGLTALQHLNISNLHNYLHKTHYLPSLKGLYGALRNLTNLKYLNLSHSLDMLIFEEGEISWCLDSIHRLTYLEHLDLSENKCLDRIPENIGNLENLCTLNLSGCYSISSLPECMRKNKLKSLLVERCSVQLINEIRSFSFDYSLTLPLFVVRGSNADSCSNLHHLKGVNPGELNICFLENVRFHEEASAVKLSDKYNLSALTLSWTSKAHRHLEDMDLLGALVPPTGLKKLEINGYGSISFPTWLMGISDHLQNLVSVTLFSLLNCSDLPPLGQLGNLENLKLQKLHRVKKVGRNFCGGKGAFQHLTSFTLRDMSGLEVWDTKYSAENCIEEFMFPVLDKLEIFKCPRLRSKPCPPIFRDCLINDSDKVIYSWDQGDSIHHTSSTPRTTLKLIKSDCLNLGLLQHLSILQELKLFKFRYIEGLPESMRRLVSLQLLELRCCERISGLPDWLSDLASLRSITIVACLGIQSLPFCVKQLTKLEKLQVEYNRKLKEWCESEENKMKLAHITDMMFYNCD